ncbi:MAG: hypothetical protein WD467_01215 [Candidatus Saccharimonadales bacterium]
MALDTTQRKCALAHLGIAYTKVGETLTVHGDEPDETTLQAAYDEAIATRPDPRAELLAAVEAATTLDELKAAIKGDGQSTLASDIL